MFQGKEYVYEVYKTQSFSKAASNLYISQPSLSATIKKIENRLGSPLFDRSSNPIQLTDCGQKYIHYIERILDMECEFENYLNNLDELRSGHLTIGGSNLFSSYILPPLLSKFMAKYPAIDVKLVEANTKSLEKQLCSGTLDFVIDNYSFSNDIYEQHFFCEEQLLLAVPSTFSSNKSLLDKQLTALDIIQKKHMLDNAPTISLEHFKADPFILLRTGNDTRERSEQLFKNAQISPSIVLKLDQQATAYHVACYGMGITFISDTLISQAPPDSRLVYYKLKDSISYRNIYFYNKRTKYITRAMEEFLNLTKLS